MKGISSLTGAAPAHGLWSSHARRPGWRQLGFTLIETMIVVAIIAILAAIAYPSYVSHIAKANRVAAEGCLSEVANYMERYYTTYLRYDQDPSTATANPYTLPGCASATQTGANYTYPAPTVLTATAYTITAVPTGTQAARDARCGTLTLDQTGTRTVSGSNGTAACW
ncbi:type IV pilin protein [Dyella soli]|uniref:Prepilin-type N-terminal cleavage/methylation domain-containing protein n=1 Tax=Dyella soli TaxID=522319 RepID=A0A4R0YWT7_9GAMM|nr:type IV pilin protein [Dyella soli]TCI10840.1 prepilin-type N-terminal cleavage/methylation domain-containing protein [Dyella soli]